MKKRKARILAVVLSICMLLQPVSSVYAAETASPQVNIDREETSVQTPAGSGEAAPSTAEPEETPEETPETSPGAEPEVTPGEIPETSKSAEPEETPAQTEDDTDDEMVSPTPSASPLPLMESLVKENELAYTGNEYDLSSGIRLEINQSLMESAGLAWNEENIQKILNVRANGEKRYHYISLVGKSGEFMDDVPVSIWNGMVSIMDESVPTNISYIEIKKLGDGSQPDQQWYFFEPYNASESINTEFSYELQKNGMGMKIKGRKRVFPVKCGAALDLYVAKDAAVYDGFRNAFDTDESYSAYDTSGNKRSDQIRVENLGDNNETLWIALEDSDMLTSGNDYVISGYRGSVSEYYGRKYLVLQKPGASFSKNQIINILQANSESQFDSITIYQDQADSDIIYSDVTNLAASILKENGTISWHYIGTGGSNLTESWIMSGLTNQESDLNVKATLEVGDTVALTVNHTDLPADLVSVSVSAVNGVPEYDTLKSEFGTESKPLVARKEGDNSAVKGYYTYSEYSTSVQISNLTDMEAGARYIIGETLGYYGTITNQQGWKELLVDNSEGKYNEGQLVEILKLNKQEDFDSVQIRLGSNNEISQKIHNTALTLLKNVQRGQIEYRYVGKDGSLTSIVLWQPSAADKNIVIDPAFYVEDNEAHFRNTAQNYPAGTVNAGFIFYVGDTYNQLKNILGTSKRLQFTAWNSKGNTTAGTYFFNAASKTYPSQIAVSVLNINELEAGDIYTVNGYRGEVDGNSLYLSAVAMGKNQFSAMDIQNIAAYYEKSGSKFDCITVDQDYSDGKTSAYSVSKDIVNAARKILKEDGELVFCFSRGIVAGSGEEGQYLQNDLNLSLVAPEEAKKDITVNVTLTPTADQGVTLKINKSKIEAPAREVNLQLYVDDRAELGKNLRAALGSPVSGDVESHVIILKNNALEESLHSDYRQEAGTEKFSLFFGDINSWEKDTAYRIVSWQDSDPKLRSADFICGRTVQLQTSKMPDAGKKITWKSYGNGIVSDITADGQMTVVGYSGEEFFYSATYVSGKTTYMEVWKGQTKPAQIEKISFSRTAVQMELPDENDTALSEEDKENLKTGWLEVRYYPSIAAVDSSELIWKSSDEAVVKLTANEDGKNYGRFEIRKAGTAEITAQYPGQTEAVARCTITVKEPLTDSAIGIDKLDGLYAMLNFDQKLSDVKLPENWQWAAPETKLSAYGQAEGYDFPAVYTSDDGRSVSRMLYVRFARLQSISIIGMTADQGKCVPCEVPEEILKNENTVLGVGYNISNGDAEDLNRYQDQISIKWECRNMNTSQEGLDFYWNDSIKVSSDTAGKKAITLSLMSNATNKKLMSAKTQITVWNGNLIDWNKMTTDIDHSNQKKGEIHFSLPQDQYYKLAIKSSDSQVVKLGKPTVERTEETVDTVVEYKNLKPGIAYITVTAEDEAKSSISYKVEWKDAAPKLADDKITVNQALADNSTEITLYAEKGYTVKTDGIHFAGKNSENFKVTACTVKTGENNQEMNIQIKPDKELKSGKYKMDLVIPMRGADSTSEEADEYIVKVDITVTDQTPAVTFKQTGKVNLFYTDEEGKGILTVVSSDKIDSLQMTGCDYTLEKATSDNEYVIQPKAGTEGKNKKGILEYRVAGYDGLYKQKVDVKTENKAPSVIMSAKTDSLYPGMNLSRSELILTEKETGERLQISKASVLVKKEEYELSEQKSLISGGKNTYDIRLINGKEGQLFTFDLTTSTNAKDSISLRVQEKNWSKPLKVDYKLNVVLKAPAVKLGSKKLVLNKNQELYADQLAESVLRWEGNNAPIDVGVSVRFEGKNTAAKQALNQSIVLEYWNEEGIISARLNDNELKTGSYKYKVWVGKNSTELEISIIDKEPGKCISLKKAGGSIDVLQRKTTAAAYKIALGNITGAVENAYLRGTDGDLFEGRINENGQLLISAREEAKLSTNVSYKVQPVLTVRNEHGGSYEVAGAVQTIKVKQGKPKITVQTKGTTFYKQRKNVITVAINATLGDQQIEIDNVWLADQNDKFELVESEEKPAYENGCISIRMLEGAYRYNGKPLKVNLMVHYKDKAGNEKESKQAITLSIK